MVKKSFLDHFSNRFSKPNSSRIKLDLVFPKQLSSMQSDDLERPVTYYEVKAAVWDCGTNKSPGLDGTFPRGCNSSFIALIPKTQNANLVKDYRPISLIGSIYKIIAKILANRLRHVVDDLISEVQSAFVSQRQILDGPFILNELLSWWIGINKMEVDKAARLVGCSTFSTPFNYLGVKVGDVMSKVKSWDEVILKLSNRLSKWKLNTLSIGGRLTLIKSVLTSIPLYQMSIFKVPIGVLNKLESIRRNFFNGVDGSARKMSWIGWNKVLASKKNGGLGVSSYFAFNRALLFKWVWRFFSDQKSLWAKFITAIHGEKGALDISICSARRSVWIDIIRSIHSLKNKNIDLMMFVSRKVGNREDTKFWEDIWLTDVALKGKFPRIYALDLYKNVSVEEKKRRYPSSYGQYTDSLGKGTLQSQVLDDGEVYFVRRCLCLGWFWVYLVHSDGKAAGNVDFLPEERGRRPSWEIKYDWKLDTVRRRLITKAENVKEFGGKTSGLKVRDIAKGIIANVSVALGDRDVNELDGKRDRELELPSHHCIPSCRYQEQSRAEWDIGDLQVKYLTM
ncbi:RNA-directed DNA polymerase, eukaryota, reverse transcriptase zinc-binding domain protein [Tanacetum coccineum]